MGVYAKVVQEILGHANISMTLGIYGHVLPSMQRDAMEGMDDIFGNEKMSRLSKLPSEQG
jgi:integrase